MECFYPCVPELKIKDYRNYQALCCGLCSQIQEQYGLAARYCRSRDAILFALLEDGLAGRDATMVRAHCPRHLYHGKEMMCHTHGIRLAAQINVMMTWKRLGTGWRSLDKRFWRRMLRPAYEKAAAEAPAMQRLIEQQQNQMEALQLAECTSYETAAEPSANLFGGLFVYCAGDDSNIQPMRRMGCALGRIYYLLDQVESYYADQQTGVYNIFLQNRLRYAAAQEKARSLCGQARQELARAYNMLDIKRNRALLENILFQGLAKSVENAGNLPARRWKEL